MEDQNHVQLTQEELEDLVIRTETGARKPDSKITRYFMFSLAVCWSLFQMWVASPLQFSLGVFVLNDSEVRILHLCFAFMLVFLSYPAWRWSPRNRIPILDWVIAISATACSFYLFAFNDDLAQRAGSPIDMDIIISIVGIFLLLLATLRALGPPLVVIAVIFLLYVYFGPSHFIPEVIRHKGASLNKIAEHMWLSTEGIYGIPLGVAASFVFLFVLFGALLDKAGAGNFFIKISFALLGHMRGGPAKASVLASGLLGLVSGSSVANAVTIGTFTIPLMKRVGFTGEKAAAVEASSSINGQIMPPVMGAAAFIMVEYVGIPYPEIVKHAFLPAIIVYIGLLYLVHLEALKSGMQPLVKLEGSRGKLSARLIANGLTISGALILGSVIYFVFNWLDKAFGENATYVILGLVTLVYLGVMWLVSREPDLVQDDPNSEVIEIPSAGKTFRTGIHYLIPLAVLVWCLMVKFLSPGLSAFWATITLMAIMVTQHAIKQIFRGEKGFVAAIRRGVIEVVEGLAAGARNMTGISIATATAGIIVGTVSLTGLSHVMADLIEYLSGDSVFLMLLFTAVMCLILGMGLPTTVNYIVVASIMANVIVILGAKNGLIVPLIAVHLFVFYFGIMADVTPPVGLASFAAAAIAGTDPIRTGIQAFYYNIRTAVLPFFFIYNTELLLIGVNSVGHGLWVFAKATVAVLLFCAATQHYFIVKNRWYETIILFVASVTLFIPNFVRDVIDPPYERADQHKIFEYVGSLPKGSIVRMRFQGENHKGELREFKTYMEIGDGKTAEERLEEFGLVLQEEHGRIIVDDVLFGSMAYKAKLDFDQTLVGLMVPREQINFRLLNIPAILLLLIVVASQSLRRKRGMAIETIGGHVKNA